MKLVNMLHSLILMTLISCSSSSITNKKVTGHQLIGGSYEMTDANGKKVTEKTFHGKYTLMFFGFTSCQTVCPVGLSAMGRALYKLPKSLQEQIQPIFVTVDPKRDKSKELKKFVSLFGKNFVALRGTTTQTRHIIKQYRGYYSKIEKDDDDYSFDHSDIIYLMSKDGKYIGHYSSSIGANELAKRIEKDLK